MNPFASNGLFFRGTLVNVSEWRVLVFRHARDPGRCLVWAPNRTCGRRSVRTGMQLWTLTARFTGGGVLAILVIGIVY